MRKNRAGIGLAIVLVALPAIAVTPSGDYGKIAKRNVFGLKDAPAAAQAAPPPAAPLPKLVLKGITTILGNKLAFLTVQPPAQAGAGPGAASKEESLMLAEGQREAGIEVLEIDTKAAQLKVNNSGTIMPLTFEKTNEKNSASAPAVPGAPQPGMGIPTPNAAPQPQTQAPTPGVQPRIPSFRNLRMQGAVGGSTLTTPTLPTTAPVPIQTNTPAQLAAQPPQGGSELTPEEQALVQELEKASTPAKQPTVPAQLQRPPTMPQLPQ
jgi:hypothetical protein